MKTGSVLFRATGAVLGLQLLLGGLLTFGFISAEAHIITGLVLLCFAITTMAVWLASKPPFRPLQGISVIIVLLFVVQIILGFATLGTGSQAIAFIHFMVALAIFGATISGVSIAMRRDNPSIAKISPENETQVS